VAALQQRVTLIRERSRVRLAGRRYSDEYRVVETQNTLNPRAGEVLKEAEIQHLIDRQVGVTIKPRE
jgi:hypothetical protein